MTNQNLTSTFNAKLLQPAELGEESSWAFVVLPKEVSETLPRRGRTTVDGTLNGHHFRATLEPDGQLSHWLKVSNELYQAADTKIGQSVEFKISPVDKEPEPDLPDDFREALAEAPEAHQVWDSTTTIARMDWIHWITSAKQTKTRVKRISDACDMLASGKKRVCCFDQSGFYSKALKAPEAVDMVDEH